MLRWLASTNHKDIGTLYIIFGAISGVAGTAFSVLMRMELANPGVGILAGNHQMYNVFITSACYSDDFFHGYADFDRWVWELDGSFNDWGSRHGVPKTE